MASSPGVFVGNHVRVSALCFEKCIITCNSAVALKMLQAMVYHPLM